MPDPAGLLPFAQPPTPPLASSPAPSRTPAEAAVAALPKSRRHCRHRVAPSPPPSPDRPTTTATLHRRPSQCRRPHPAQNRRPRRRPRTRLRRDLPPPPPPCASPPLPACLDLATPATIGARPPAVLAARSVGRIQRRSIFLLHRALQHLMATTTALAVVCGPQRWLGPTFRLDEPAQEASTPAPWDLRSDRDPLAAAMELLPRHPRPTSFTYHRGAECLPYLIQRSFPPRLLPCLKEPNCMCPRR
uniref:Uncharacterized protein n=1 Tax=Triticum urartu TaxID=4572 RepID=A0A8R7NYV0_TRIUA